MIAVSDARYDSEYKIWIKFNTGESGVADLSDLPHKFKAAIPLNNIDEFRRFYLDDWPTLAWKCGFDLSPESLYERVTGKNQEWTEPTQKTTDAMQK